MDPALRLHPGQQELTPEQEAEARRFAEEYLRKQLSTEPIDEQEAEALLRQAYAMAGLDLSQRIHWLDGPSQRWLLEAQGPVCGSAWEPVCATAWEPA